MSIADVQRAFRRGLNDRASCKMATIELEDGGRLQRLNFHVVSGSMGAAYLSETIPADMCPMQHARHMAQEFLEGRIAGTSRFVTQPTTLNMTQDEGTQTLPDATAGRIQDSRPQATHAATMPVPVAQTVAPPLTPRESTKPVEKTPVQPPDEFELLVAAGNLDAVRDLVCDWIDADAGGVRNVWTSDKPGLVLEYEQVRREINDLAYKLIEPTPETCPCLWASVGVDVPATGDNATDIRAAALAINDAIDATNGFLARVRAVRLKAKAAVRSAQSIDDILAEYSAIQWPVS